MECQEDVHFLCNALIVIILGENNQINYVLIIVLVPNRHSGIIYLMLTLNIGIGITFPEI